MEPSNGQCSLISASVVPVHPFASGSRLPFISTRICISSRNSAAASSYESFSSILQMQHSSSHLLVAAGGSCRLAGFIGWFRLPILLWPIDASEESIECARRLVVEQLSQRLLVPLVEAHVRSCLQNAVRLGSEFFVAAGFVCKILHFHVKFYVNLYCIKQISPKDFTVIFTWPDRFVPWVVPLRCRVSVRAGRLPDAWHRL